jgi:capsular polysaccharide biosynthesis protein/Mrp family chromosome partitioning ATPase
MELGFVLSALQRRWWIVVIFTALFGILSSLIFSESAQRYQSQSVLLVVPSSFGGTVQSFGDSNRYVQGQMSAMDSGTFQAEVALRVGGSETADTVNDAVVLSNKPNTDIVTIDVFTLSADRSEEIANAFANEYIDQLTVESANDQRSLSDDIKEKKADLSNKITESNEAISDTIRPILNRLIDSGANIDPAILDPTNTTQRDLLIAEFEKTVEQELALESGDEVKVNSSIVQVAGRAQAPIAESNALKIVAGLVGGLGLGSLIALLWNRFSPRVSDEAMVAEILGLPIAANIPRVRALTRRPELALIDPPEPIRAAVGRIAVAAEAKGPVHRPTRIVVVGAQRGSGATTLAMLVAHEFSTLDSDVALVDANPRTRQLQHVIGHIDATFGDLQTESLDRFDSEVVVVGPSMGDPRIRRSDVRQFLDEVGESSRIVVVDAGSVLSSAATVELCAQADAVILAVPTNRQNIATLQAVARAIGRTDALVVTTTPKKRVNREDRIANSLPSNRSEAPDFAREHDPIEVGSR